MPPSLGGDQSKDKKQVKSANSEQEGVFSTEADYLEAVSFRSQAGPAQPLLSSALRTPMKKLGNDALVH